MAIVVLHGDLAQYGVRHEFDAASPSEVVRALCSQLKGFRQRLQQGHFRVVREASGRRRDLVAETLGTALGEQHTLHLMPVVAGSNGRGAGKVVLGVVLVAAAFAFAPAVIGALGPTLGMSSTAFSVLGMSVSFSQIAGFGAAMILSGVSQMLSPSLSGFGAGQNPVDANASSLFSGPVNVAEQGNVIPLVYGRFVAGSVVISAALTAEQIGRSNSAIDTGDT